MFRFFRKNDQGKPEEQEVTQEEFDALERNSATLEEVNQLFGEEAEQEEFNVVTTVEELLQSNEAIGAAFGEEAEAEGFDASARIQELLAIEQEHAEISRLAEPLKGANLIDKIKGIKPTGKSNPVKSSAEKDENLEVKKTFQDFEHNKAMIKELKQMGVKLASVDYSKLN